MKKHFNNIRLSKLWLALAALALLAWAGCSSPLENEKLSEKLEGSLRITVANGGARTLFPSSTPSFTKYTLDFTGPAGATHSTVTISSGTTTTIENLIAGEWTITAKGYANLGGGGSEVAVAEGEKKVIISGGSQNITIDISAQQTDGDNGTFIYNVTWPASKVTYTYIDLYTLGGGGHAYKNENGNVGAFNSGTPLSVDVAPGYYIMSVNLYTADEQCAGWSEVVHIYSYMETVFQHEFTDEDFATFITLSGAMNVTLNGIPINGGGVAIRKLNNIFDDDNWVAWANIDEDTNEWSVKISAFDTSTNLRFTYMNGFYEVGYVDRAVHNTNVSNIDLTGNLTQSYAKTLTFEVNNYNDADHGFKAALGGVHQNNTTGFLPSSHPRMFAGEYYVLKYSLISTEDIDNLTVYLVDDFEDWIVLSNYNNIEHIEKETVVAGELYLCVYRTARGTTDAYNKIRFDTDEAVATAPTINFLQLDFEFVRQNPVYALDRNEGGGGEDYGWQTKLYIRDLIDGWSYGERVLPGDEYTFTYRFFSSVDIDLFDDINSSSNLKVALVDNTESAFNVGGWWYVLAEYTSLHDDYIYAGGWYEKKIVLSVDGERASSVADDANCFIIAVDESYGDNDNPHGTGADDQPILYFTDFRLERTKTGSLVITLPANYWGREPLPENQEGWEVQISLQEFIPGVKIKAGDRFHLEFELESNVDINGGVGFMMADNTEEVGWWNQLANWVSITNGGSLSAGNRGSYYVSMTTYDNATGDERNANNLIITTDMGIGETQPVLTFYNLRIYKDN